MAEVGEDDQHPDPQLLPVPAEEGGVLRGVGAYQRHPAPSPRCNPGRGEGVGVRGVRVRE